MKRHAALLQLSREHHHALKLSLDCRRSASAGEEAARAWCSQVPSIFAHELEPHFQCEEHDLLPWLEAAGEKDLVARTLAEHELLRRLARQIGEGEWQELEVFAQALADHVRFEERELFERAQTFPAFAAGLNI